MLNITHLLPSFVLFATLSVTAMFIVLWHLRTDARPDAST